MIETKKKVEFVPIIYIKDKKEKEWFYREIAKISKIGIITENNYKAVFTHRDRLLRKLIRPLLNPNRFQPSRDSQEYKEWRKAVFERDSYTCVECHEVGGRLEAHHLKAWADYAELRFKIDNGVTLCKKCHELTDTYLWRYFRKKNSVSTSQASR